MRIGFCIFKYFPFGGIQRDVIKMADECLRRGHQVRIYSIRWLADQPERFDIRLAPVKAFTNHVLYERFADWVQQDTQRDPVDVLVGMNKMAGLDVYYAGDSCYEDKARSQRSFWYRLTPRYRSFRRQEASVFARGAHTRIMMISNVHKTAFRRYYGTEPERFVDLPPGIEKDRRRPEDALVAEIRSQTREQLGVDGDEHLLLFVGSGFIKKGLDRLLRSLQALPETIAAKTRLLVVGKDNAEPFRRMAGRLGVDRAVEFFAEGRDDIPSLLLAADGLALPAYDENAGMVILEAMIAGLPVVATANCGYARYLEEAGAGLVCPEPFVQAEFDAQLVQLLTSDKRADWTAAGVAFGNRDDIYQLVPRAVDVIEQEARHCES